MQVNEAEATDIQDNYQAFAPSEALTMCWHGSSTLDTETSRRIRVQYKGSSQFQAVQLTFHTLGANGPLPKAAQKVNSTMVQTVMTNIPLGSQHRKFIGNYSSATTGRTILNTSSPTCNIGSSQQQPRDNSQAVNASEITQHKAHNFRET